MERAHFGSGWHNAVAYSTTIPRGQRTDGIAGGTAHREKRKTAIPLIGSAQAAQSVASQGNCREFRAGPSSDPLGENGRA
jgi:hypothetical protein